MSTLACLHFEFHNTLFILSHPCFGICLLSWTRLIKLHGPSHQETSLLFITSHGQHKMAKSRRNFTPNSYDCILNTKELGAQRAYHFMVEPLRDFTLTRLVSFSTLMSQGHEEILL